MPQVTYVKKAQRRYATVIVRDAEGNPVTTPVMLKDGTQKTTKTGRPVVLTKTVADLTKPMPLYECDFCHKEIAVGSPYKHISPKSGPYGGRQLNRHGDCPNWQPWDYSSSLSARTAQIAWEFNNGLSSCESVDDVQDLLNQAAEAVREIQQEKDEAASNQEEYFGGFSEIREVADALESWADEIEGADVPEFPEPEETECPDCDPEEKEGNVCKTCGGSGYFTPDDPTEEQIEQWQSEVADSVTVVDECPV